MARTNRAPAPRRSPTDPANRRAPRQYQQRQQRAVEACYRAALATLDTARVEVCDALA